MKDWRIYRGTGKPDRAAMDRLPPPPPWRDFAELDRRRGKTYQPSDEEIDAVNAALYLRRPLLVTGSPGRGKSSLAYAVAEELGLGSVLRWSINSRSTLASGLYQYDAIAHLRDVGLEEKGVLPAGISKDIGRYIRLGPLGTALLPAERPRVLLIDEIDKSDLDLPNDLLHVFEEGRFEIPELVRLAGWTDPAAPKGKAKEARSTVFRIMPYDRSADTERVGVEDGRVTCRAFPVVFLTSNDEKELPAAFFRRCLRLNLPDPTLERLEEIVRAHLGEVEPKLRSAVIETFLSKQEGGAVLATDQLLNALLLLTRGSIPVGEDRERLVEMILRELSNT